MLFSSILWITSQNQTKLFALRFGNCIGIFGKFMHVVAKLSAQFLTDAPHVIDGCFFGLSGGGFDIDLSHALNYSKVVQIQRTGFQTGVACGRLSS